MFKKTLLAATIAAMSAGAFAGDLTVTASTYSAEGLAVANETANYAVDAAVGTYVVNTAYPVGAKVVLTLTDAAVAAGYVFPTTISGFDNSALPGGAAAPVADILATPTRLSNDSVEYTVAKAMASGDSLTLNLGAGTLLGKTVAASTVSMTVTAKYASGAVLDPTGTNTKELTKVASQFADNFKATATFGEKIDVAKERLALVGTTSDSATFTFDAYNALVEAVAPTKLTLKVNADLTGFAVDKDSKEITGVAVTGVTLDGVVAYDADKKQLSFATTAATAPTANTFTVTITPPVTDEGAETEAVELLIQDFSATAEYTYDTDKTASIGTAAAGSWTLNGSLANIPYMPFGDTIDNIIYVTNEGTVAGDITVDAVVNGEKLSLGVIGQATAKTVTPIASEIKAALVAAGVVDAAKVKLTVVVNSPSNDITVYGAYKVGSDRGYVPVENL